MSALSEPLLAGIEAALRAGSPNPLATAMGLAVPRIYTTPPTNAPLPYVLIGDDQILGDDTECADGAEAFCTVHVWARPNPPEGSTARGIADVIRDALNAPITVTGHEVVDWQIESLNFITDPDSSTHGVIRVRYLITELVA